MAGAVRKPAILFTAFEPSGDAIGAPVIRRLAESEAVEVYACGGSRMEAAGARLVARTADNAAMGISGLRRVRAVRRLIRDLRSWAVDKRLVAHVPVDAPAANFPVARTMKRTGAKIVHLVSPQLWAWGRWRARKLRRLTSLVLCVLPFEEEWLERLRIPARFIGHPAINRSIDLDELREMMHGLPHGAPRVALFPGSRGHEVRANTRLLVDVYAQLQARHAGLCGVIVAASPQLARLIRRRIDVFPTGLHMMTGSADPAIAWCDMALAVSGTITLDIARQYKPMVGVYKTSWAAWLAARLMLRTHYRLLPNLVAEREIVPEFVPHAGGPAPIVREATRFLLDSKNGAVQAEALRQVCLRFANHRPGKEAADAILQVALG